MARTIAPTMSRVLERLELERPEIVTSAELAQILGEEGISTPAAVFAARLRDKGWLLPTGQRGVWEFAPAAVAGPYSSMDPLLPVKAFAAAHPDCGAALTMHAAAWALGLADRAPAVMDVALPASPGKAAIPEGMATHVFSPALPTVEVRGAESLAPESALVHMAARPNEVRSWQSAQEWLPSMAYEASAGRILKELASRPPSVWARAGYLLQGMRPDVSEAIASERKPISKVRFGPRTQSLRNDERWNISDTALPFDPRDLEGVR